MSLLDLIIGFVSGVGVLVTGELLFGFYKDRKSKVRIAMGIEIKGPDIKVTVDSNRQPRMIANTIASCGARNVGGG